jgi:hypothetical protein
MKVPENEGRKVDVEDKGRREGDGRERNIVKEDGDP